MSLSGFSSGFRWYITRTLFPNMTNRHHTALCAALALAFGCNLFAGTWDARGDFSTASNPNGSWSYGTTPTLGAAFTQFSSVGSADCGNSSIQGWQNAGSPPYVQANNTGSGQICAGYINIPNDVLHMHPGGDSSYSVTRWTAPEDGIFQISGFFSSLNPNVSATDEHVLVNGTAAVNINIHSFNIPSTFNFAVTLSQGATVDFVVGTGGNGNADDSTALSATITSGGAATPEPGTIWLFSGVMAAGAAIRRRVTR